MPDAQRMQCMEVWGGNQPFSGGVVMAGLDAWIYSQPYGSASEGGDIHYVSSCATGRITRLLVADVSGHGAAVSDAAASLRMLMRRFVNYIDQTCFVEAMNQQFAAMSAAHMFATAIVTTYFSPTGHLSLTNAGHPPPLLFTAKTGRWQLLQEGSVRPPRDTSEVANIPLGILDATSYDQFDIKLAVGDRVLCYTDSLIEALDEGGQLLGPEGLFEIVQSLEPADAVDCISALMQSIRSKHPGNLTEDDVTILLFRPNGLAPRLPFSERIRAPLRVARGILRSLVARGQPAPWPDLKLANIGGVLLPSLGRRWVGRRRQNS